MTETSTALETERAIQEGARRWAAAHDGRPEMSDVIWLLLEEAAETQKGLRADGPPKRTTWWPDLVWTSAELVGAQNEQSIEAFRARKEGRLAEDVFIPDRGTAESPSAAALRRYDEVMRWLRYIRARSQKARRMELLLALAGGLSQRRAVEHPRFACLQYGDRSSVSKFRAASLEQIEYRIRREHPRLCLGAHIAA